MATSAPKIIQAYLKGIESGWEPELFFGNKRLRDKFVSWLLSKKLGKAGEQREQFLFVIQRNLCVERHWTADDQQLTKETISDAKEHFDKFSSLTKQLSMCLSGMRRNSLVQIDQVMALGGLSETNQKEDSFLLSSEGSDYFDRLSRAAESAASNLKGSPGPTAYHDFLIKRIGFAWLYYFDVTPSCSDKSIFRQFILLLNNEIGTCLPTSSSSLRRALKQ